MSKYKFDTKKIKIRLKELRRSKKLTQAKFAEMINRGTGTSRTAVTTWENVNNETLPDIQTLMDICNVFDCDFEYLFGKSDIKSQDHQTISNVLHISEESINTLKDNSGYGQLVNSLINNEIFGEISRRAHQLALNKVLNDVITTSFSQNFENKLKNLFNDYYYSVFPSDMSQENFCEYIKGSIPYSENFNPLEFIEDNFREDGKAFVYNSNDKFLSLCKPEQYKIIISSIADISYDYFISQNVVELSKQKLDLMLSDLLQTAINKETEEIKASIKRNVT